MEFIKQKFIEQFNMERVARDLMNMIDEDKLLNYIYEEFGDNFMYGELYDLFKNELSKEDLQCLLEEMGFDFVDLDELDEEEKDKYY